MRALMGGSASLAAIMALGCASASVKDVVLDPLKHAGARRVYLLVDHSAARLECEDFGETLRGALSDALTKQKVENQSRSVESGDVDSHSVPIRLYGPDAVLVVKVTSAEPFYYKMFRKCGGALAGYSTVFYEVTVLDATLEKPLWRATVSNRGGTSLMKARLRKMAAAIVKRLQSDGVL
jgi:hypothetical protein